MHSDNGLIQVIMLITDLCLQRTYAYSYIKVLVGTTQVHYTEVPVGTTGLILYYRTYKFIQVSRRSYKAYSYSEIPVGITDQNDTPSFPLIHYSSYYHIIMGIPRAVLIKV